jgi:hypothetical protein
LRLRTADTLARLAQADEGRWWELLAVSQVVSPRSELGRPVEDRGPHGPPERGARLWYLPQHTPPVWRANAAERPADDEAALERLAADDFDPLATVLLAEGEPGGPYPGRAGVGLTSRRAGEVVAETFGDEPGWVVFSEMAYPGWRAELDGQPVQPLRAHIALLAVPVPAGSHTVRLGFTAPWVLAGIAVSLTALAAFLLAALWVLWPGTVRRGDWRPLP